MQLSTTTQPAAQPHLIRALGRRDLVLLFVVAVFNLNVVPSIAANGGVTIWLWIISLLLFFWPQGIAVIELAHRYPGEGGVYLWAKEVFGDFHGFLSGWCYWTNNMLYVPTVMLYFVGVSVFAMGPGHAGLADNKSFAMAASLVLLTVLTILNIVGLGVGKWLNNLGAIGTFVAAAVLIGLGVTVCARFGTTVTAADFRIPRDPWFVLNSFGVICFGLVGLELASVMGDEIKDPQKTLPGAVAWGGVVSGALYIGATLTLLIAVGKNEISVLQGIVQAVSHMAGKVGVVWIVTPVCADAEPLHRGHWLGVDGWVGANSVCRRPRFLHAVVVGQSASQVRNSLRGVDRASGGLAGIDRHQFLCFRRRTGNVSDHVVTRGRLAVDSVPVRLWRAAEICFQGKSWGWTLWPPYSRICRIVRISDHDLRNRARLLSRQADHFGMEV
jgi:hypothetical protein